MRLRLRERWRLFIHNWIKAPYRHLAFRRWWINSGRDPKAIPLLIRGRLTLADLDWAAAEARKIIAGPVPETIPFEEFRERVRAMRQQPPADA